MALVSLDVKNAFGAVEWPDALDACMRLVPAIAPALAAMWAPGHVHIHVETATNQWTRIPVYGSLLQGGQDGHSVFCLVISIALSRATAVFAATAAARETANDPTAPLWRLVSHWAYVDDILLQIPLDILGQVLRVVNT